MRAVRYSNGASKDIRKSIAVNLPDKASFSHIKKGSNSSASIFSGKKHKISEHAILLCSALPKFGLLTQLHLEFWPF